MKILIQISTLILIFLFSFSSCLDREDPPGGNSDILQLVSARIGQISLSPNSNVEVPFGKDLVLSFTQSIDPTTKGAVVLYDATTNDPMNVALEISDQNKLITLRQDNSWAHGLNLKLSVSNQLKGELGETFSGVDYEFHIEKAPLELITITVDGEAVLSKITNTEISLNPVFSLHFSEEVPPSVLENELILVGNKNYGLSVKTTTTNAVEVSVSETLDDLEKLIFILPPEIGDAIGKPFEPRNYFLQTRLDSTPDFPLITDDELLTLIQSNTFRYFWELGHPASGMARERNSSGNIVTTGGTGFGLMAMIAAVERGFISRQNAIQRWEKIIGFLETADRFHGAWAHWMDGNTGKVKPFSQYDNGGDLVETAFLVQGLLTIRQYLNPDVTEENELINRINQLWETIEWDWYTRGGQNVLYWHWSPNYNWQMNLPIRGHNETQIVYVLAASSPGHSITKAVYDEGYARNGAILNGNTYYNIELPVGYGRGGPLFFSHYSYLGMDPRHLVDPYANYWQQNVAHTLINRAYCMDNPGNYIGYSEDCWGLTASDNQDGYSAHSPDNDLGVISPTAAISSLPYAPEECMRAIRFFYYVLGDRLWGEYGFYDAFNLTEGWTASSTLAIDQGPIICMIENHRTALLWELFMSAPEIKLGLDKLGFTY